MKWNKNAPHYTRLINQAKRYAEQKHLGQKSEFGGDYYIEQLLPTIKMVEQATNDAFPIIIATLSNILLDTKTTIEELETTFGEEIAKEIEKRTQYYEGELEELDFTQQAIIYIQRSQILLNKQSGK